MVATNSKRRKAARSYQQEFLLLGFQPSNADSDKPKCVDCGLVTTNDSMKKSKLLAHEQLKHPGSVGKERSYFENKAELCKENAPKPLKSYINRANERSIKTLRASYAVNELAAKVGKSHTIAEH